EIERRADRARGRRVRGAADHHRLHAVAREIGGERREIFGRPALRAAVRGAGRERDERRASVPAGRREQPRAVRARAIGDGHARRRRSVREAERGDEALVILDLMQRRVRTRDRSRQQQRAAVGAVSPAFGHARAPGGERRAERVRQQQRGVDSVDEGEQRRDRRTRGDGDRRVRLRAAHVRDRRQRHHGVAQPVRREDDQPLIHVVRLLVPMPTLKDPLLSVVMPVYNERTTIDEIIRRVLAVPLRIELIVVDDGSRVGTGDLLDALQKELKFTLLRQENAGKGAALRRGFAAVTGDIAVIQDADLEYSPEEFPQLIELICQGKADVVYGSRFLGRHRAFMFAHYMGNKFVTFATNVLYNTMLTDMETCYKAMRTEVLRSM